MEGEPPEVEVRLCDACNGVWLSAEALAPICPTLSHLPGRKTEIRLTGTGSKIFCPGCGRQPWESEVLDVVVDVCLTCGGIWLDAGEYSDEQAAEPSRKAARPGYRERARSKAGAPTCAYCGAFVDATRAMVREHGFACERCHYALETRVAALRAERSPLEKFLDRVAELLATDDPDG